MEAAKQEGEVVFYFNSVPQPMEEFERRFEAEYPEIDLKAERLGGNDMLARVEAEIANDAIAADVMNIADEVWTDTQVEAGIFTPPLGPAFDGDTFDTDTWMANGSTFAGYTGVGCWAWNTNEVPNGITEWDDFLDPALAGGKIGLLDATVGGVLTHMWSVTQDQAGPDWMEALADQSPRVFASSAEMLSAIGAGEIVATPYASFGAVTTEAANGLPVEGGLWPGGSWAPVFYTGVFADAPNPNAAQVLVNFLMSESGQEALAIDGASALPDISTTAVPIEEIIPAQDPNADEIEEFVVRFANLYQ